MFSFFNDIVYLSISLKLTLLDKSTIINDSKNSAVTIINNIFEIIDCFCH